MSKQYLTNGTFCLGANYWASHAGVNIWKDWRPDVVENDFQILAENKIKVLRVFPLLSDFMPITIMYGGVSTPLEIAHGEKFLDKTTEEGRCGIDIESIE